MSEFEWKQVKVEVTVTVQVRPGHETRDMLVARKRFRQHITQNGPINSDREDPGILHVSIGHWKD